MIDETHFSSFARYFFVIGLCLWLSACSGENAAPITPDTSPKASLTAGITATSTISPTIALTPTLQPPRPTYTSLPTETPDVYATQIAGFPFKCQDPEYYPLNSLHGDWAVEICDDERDGKWDSTLEIVNKSGARWVLNYMDYFPSTLSAGDIGIGRLVPVHWSNDGQYLYYVLQILYSGGGQCFYGFGAQGLYRLKLSDGTTSAVLPYSTSILGYLNAFSPTGRLLVYQGLGAPVIMDLKTGEKINFKSEYDQVGTFRWSPDGKELAFADCLPSNDINDPYPAKRSAIKIFTLAERSYRTVLEAEQAKLSVVWWGKDNILEIEQDDYHNRPVDLYFDVSTNQFVTATPTP
jgi:hypothetical protein